MGRSIAPSLRTTPSVVRRSVEERFWSKVNKEGSAPEHRPELGPCWLWTAGLRKGYGQFHVKRRKQPAHRYAWNLLVGPIPEGLEPDHLCRVRACVKAIANEQGPAHLEPVTRGENARRGDLGIRTKERIQAMTHCKNGHLITDENTCWAPNGGRFCHTCRIESWRAYRRRKKAAS